MDQRSATAVARQESTMTIALDLGSHSFRSLRFEGDALRARTVRAAWCALPDTGSHRRLLDKSGLTFLECDSGLIVPGDGGIEISRLLERPASPLLPGGRLTAGDALSRQIINVLLEAILPVPAEPGTSCSVTLPSAANDETASFLLRLVRLRGYSPVAVPSGLALALAELGSERFSGIALVAGHSATQITAAHLGRELVSTTSSRAGVWLDEQLVRERIDCDEKESLAAGSVNTFQRLCRELAWDLANDVVQILTSPLGKRLPGPVPIVCGGGLANVPGFSQLVCEAVTRRAPACAVRLVTPSDTSRYTIARGALIHGELETQSLRISA